MKIGEFLRENNLSKGDNISLLLKKLNMGDEKLLKKIEDEIGESAKMSKSKGNTVDPEDAIKEFGADTVRLYILFTAPPENDFEWSEEGIRGSYRFLNRLWDFVTSKIDDLKDVCYSREELKDVKGRAKELRYKIHSCLDRYLKDIEKRYQFNTAIASAMTLLNELEEFDPQEEIDRKVLKEGVEILLLMLSPITPHICEELWKLLGKEGYISAERLPEVCKEAITLDEVEIGVQINGKLRGRLKVKIDEKEENIISRIKADPKLGRYVNGKNIRKIVYIKNKLVNLVVS